MKTFLLWIQKYFYPLLLTLLVGILVGANYTPGTYLSGWDTLHPEFNLPLAFSRIFTGVWRTDQGLGAVAIQSHMAELPRLLYLWIMSFVLPTNMLRYSYFFLMLLAGPLGIYTLIHKVLRHKSAAFIGALVYLCNFATVQQFIVPLEMFATQYGLLPWILLITLHFLQKPTKKLGFIFAALSFFASAQAHTATLLYAYITVFIGVLAVYGTLHKEHWKRIFAVIAIILATNLYIILPNLYAAKTHGLDVADSKVNRLFSPEAFAKNQLYGTPANAAVVKNFLFDWELYDNTTHQFAPVLGPWVTFANYPFVVATGYGVFALSIIGIGLTFKRKQKILLSFLPIYIVSFLMLLNGTWPMPDLFETLGKFAPIAREAIRFPFTKFSILFITGLSIFAAYAVDFFFKKVKVIFVLIACALLFSFLPAFQGYLIQPAMRITIPQEYFDMFSWFSTQPKDERVAILPIHSFWNWTYYRWGYQGAGFLQFGIPQPILDRDYDRWSPYNEQYEKEMSYAVYSQNPDNIRITIAKYNVTWVLVDNSVFAPASNENQTLLWLLPELLQKAGLVKVKTFGNDITIYRADTALPIVTGYINTPNSSLLNPYFSLVNTNERIVEPISGTVVAEGKGRTYQSTNKPDTDHVDIPTLDHNHNYLLEITSKHTSGFPLQLCVINSLTSHCDLSVHLGTQSQLATERFLLPNLSDFGSGYNLNFNNFTIQGMTSINEIQSIRISRFEDLPANTQLTAQPMREDVSPLLPILYRVKITSPTNVLVLHQSFEQGWIAFNSTKKTISTHILIDAWMNGWTGNIDTNDIIYIIFWPQILEWVGFALLPISVWIAIKNI